MTTETTTPTPTTDDATAAASAAGEDTALGSAATVEADGKSEAAAEGDKPEGEAKPETDAAVTGAPEAYDTAAFKMPEGVEFDAEGFAAVEPVLRELDLNQEQAGALMSVYAEKIVPMIAQRTAQQFDEQGAEMRANLARDLQADAEVGGKKLDESKAMAAKAIAHFIPKPSERSEFSTFLNESGLGNHKLLMRIVAGAGRNLSEASTPPAETATAELTAAEKFYGRKANS